MNKKQLQEAVKKYGPVYVERGEDEVLQFLEIDKVKEADGKVILAEIKKAISNSFVAQETVSAPSPDQIERPKEIKKGLKLYDMFKVQKELEENGSGGQSWTGNFIKVGKPIKTNIKVEPYRADIFNSQSVNSGERLYEVEM